MNKIVIIGPMMTGKTYLAELVRLGIQAKEGTKCAVIDEIKFPLNSFEKRRIRQPLGEVGTLICICDDDYKAKALQDELGIRFNLSIRPRIDERFDNQTLAIESERISKRMEELALQKENEAAIAAKIKELYCELENRAKEIRRLNDLMGQAYAHIEKAFVKPNKFTRSVRDFLMVACKLLRS